MGKLSRFVTIFFIAALLFLACDLVNIFLFTPVETSQGIIQKIFYVHVPSAFAMYIGFTMGFIFSILYLLKRKDIFDTVAYSSIEVGFVFAICVLASGPLWAKGTWGRFWDFDPRLTSTLVIWFIYFSYLVLRKYYGVSERGKLFSAIVAIIGFIDVPIVHYSVRIWRGIHPSILAQRVTRQTLPASMWKALLFSTFTFVIIYMFIFLLKLRKEMQLKEKRVQN